MSRPMPIEYSVFEKALNDKGALKIKNQCIVKDSQPIFSACTPKNGIKCDITNRPREGARYTAGFNLADNLMDVLIDELADRGIKFEKRKAMNLTFSVNEADILGGFIELFDIVNDIDGIEQRRQARARWGIEFIPEGIYLGMADSILSGVNRGLPSKLNRTEFDSYDELITVGHSAQALLDMKNGKPVWREHVVPCILLLDEGVRMAKAGASDVEIAAMLKANLHIVLVSVEERERMDFALGLQTTMPEGWKFGDDPFARLRIANVVFDK